MDELNFYMKACFTWTYIKVLVEYSMTEVLYLFVTVLGTSSGVIV
jgi:hypothetical protein